MSETVLLKVCLARFPFIDPKQDKIRPVIVISKHYGPYQTITVIPISSKPNKTSIDVTIQGWQHAGLIKLSVARIHRISTILREDLISELGELDSRDSRAVQQAIKKYLFI